MTTLQALKILKTEFDDLNIPQKDGSFKSLMCLEDVLIEVQIMAWCFKQKKKMSRKINRVCWRIPSQVHKEKIFEINMKELATLS